MTVTARRGLLGKATLGLFALLASLVLMAFAPTTAGAQFGGDPEAQAAEQLRELKQALRDAQDEDNRFGGRFRAHLDRAVDAKLAFAALAFEGVQVMNGCSLAGLLVTLEQLDISLTAATLNDNKGQRRNLLKQARSTAQILLDELDRCGTQESVAAAERILERIGALLAKDEDGDLKDSEVEGVATDVHREKLGMLEGLTVDGCSVKSIYRKVHALDVQIARAYFLSDDKPKGDKKKRAANKEIRELVEDALKKARQLRKSYKAIPCE